MPKMPKKLSKALQPLGILPTEQGRELFYETTEKVTLPRLQSVGLDAFDGWKRRRRFLGR